jgi:hypothetical protein
MVQPAVGPSRSFLPDDRSDARGGDARGSRGRRYRLAWRWKASGTTGQGPWMARSDVVEAWLDSFDRRYRDVTDHWIEVDPTP